MALFIGILFKNVGEDVEKVRDNYNFLYFSLMFLMFNAFSAVSIRCKYINVAMQITQRIYFYTILLLNIYNELKKIKLKPDWTIIGFRQQVKRTRKDSNPVKGNIERINAC